MYIIDNLEDNKCIFNMLLCRELGHFDLDEIQMAVFEHNGKLSVLPKASRRPATPTDLKIPAKASYVGTEIIMDGRIMGENLTRLQKKEKWLDDQVKLQGYRSPKEIFLGVYRKEDDSISFYATN